MTLQQAAILFVTALVGGAVNSVAGGGSFLCFPALVVTGMPPINANATNTMALWPGTLASVGAYRRELAGEGRNMLLPLVVTGFIGGVLGAVILLKTPQATFLRLIPYLLASSTLLFVFSGIISKWIRQRSEHMKNRTRLAMLGGALVQLCIAVYIGFFGAGAGILMLALFAILGVESIHTMNAYKTVLATICNGVAIVTFIIAGAVVWPQALLMLVGAAAGGYYGAFYAQRMNPAHVRYAVIATGAAMSLYFFVKQGL
ncbi:MAG TPA: sulfite exporter TauE/SafE family protein [Clostridia bacterium]|nr:sulfite exporter TauE/SafE family protein [Clostridia bacterium]